MSFVRELKEKSTRRDFFRLIILIFYRKTIFFFNVVGRATETRSREECTFRDRRRNDDGVLAFPFRSSSDCCEGIHPFWSPENAFRKSRDFSILLNYRTKRESADLLSFLIMDWSLILVGLVRFFFFLLNWMHASTFILFCFSLLSRLVLSIRSLFKIFFLLILFLLISLFSLPYLNYIKCYYFFHNFSNFDCFLCLIRFCF